MPSSRKYANVLDNIKLDENTLSFIRKHIGDQAVVELQNIWHEGVKQIPEDASFEDKYEIAYSNWIWMGSVDFNFIHQRLGVEGIEQFKRMEVDVLKRKNASPALLFLRLVRSLSPGLAFKMIANQMVYQLQWVNAFSVSELTPDRAVLDILRCKILDFPDSEEICVIGCQGIYPMWVAEQFRVRMAHERQGNSCTCILTPLL
jgi:hypothetical protein